MTVTLRKQGAREHTLPLVGGLLGLGQFRQRVFVLPHDFAASLKLMLYRRVVGVLDRRGKEVTCSRLHRKEGISTLYLHVGKHFFRE